MSSESPERRDRDRDRERGDRGDRDRDRDRRKKKSQPCSLFVRNLVKILKPKISQDSVEL